MAHARDILPHAKRVHFIGIKGAGMSALAVLLHTRGVVVSGSDVSDVFHTDAALTQAGITVQEGFQVSNLDGKSDCIIYSTSYSEDNNSEFAHATSDTTPLFSYAEAVGALLEEFYGIAVCGTHGKTTTTALLAQIFVDANLDPTAVVGGFVPQWKSNALIGQGEHMIIEADEYQNKLQYYSPLGVVLTNINYDHPDYFSSHEDYVKVFKDFIERIAQQGFLVACGDDAQVRDVIKAARCSVETYGFDAGNNFVITNYAPFTDEDYVTYKVQRKHLTTQKFDVERDGHFYGTFALELPGKHNALNALAAIVSAHHFEIAISSVRKSVHNFGGTARRFEYRGEKKGVRYFDDYAHHPEEIKATLQAAREQFPTNRIWIVFHPHTFSRTHVFLTDFAGAFSFADQILVLDVYGSAREDTGGVSSQDLVDKVNELIAHKAHLTPTVSDAARHITENVGRGDVVITMGAGDVWRVHELLK